MSERTLARRRAKVVFSTENKAEVLSSSRCVIDPTAMTIKATLLDRPLTWHFSQYKRRSVAFEVLELLGWMIDSGRYFTSFAFAKQYKLKVGGFITRLEQIDPAGQIQSLRDIGRGWLDQLDQPNMRNTDWDRLQKITKLLRAARTRDPNSVASDLKCPELGDRLSFVSRYAKPEVTPRDPYSLYVEDQIVKAARADIADCTRRLRAGRALLCLPEEGATPRSPVQATALHLAEYAILRPPVWGRILSAFGVGRQTPRKYIDVEKYGHANLQKAALYLVGGTPQYEVEDTFGWTRRTVANLLEFCPPFKAMLRTAECDWIDKIKTQAREARQFDQQTSHLSLVVANERPELINGSSRLQLVRRLAVLRVWNQRGVAHDKLGSLSFTWAGVTGWTDTEYHFNSLGDPRSVARAHSDLHNEIESVLAQLRSRYGPCTQSEQYTQYLRRVQIIESWLDNPSEAQSFNEYTKNSLIDWRDERLRVEPIGRASALTRNKQCQSYLLRAFASLRALELSLRHKREDQAGPAPLVEIATAAEVAAELCPTSCDLTSILCRLSLLVQIDSGSLQSLRRDCLRNEANGFVDIVYRKARDAHSTKVERVRDGSLETPGGLIRLAIELTETANSALQRQGSRDAGQLWLAAEGNGFKRYQFKGTHPRNPWSRFCSRHHIIDDHGLALDRLQPSRFRKTVKANKYQKAQGDIFAIADDHSYAVSRDHYANLPALQSLHDDTVERGLQRALKEVTSRVVDDTKSRASEAARLARATGIDEQICRDVIDGKEDTWLAGCLGFRSNPFTKAGDPCDALFTECLHCQNSVFTTRRLPNLLRYERLLERRRPIVSDAEWDAFYRDDYDRLTKQILPRFSVVQKKEAQRALETDADTAFLMPLVIERAF